MRDQAGAEDRRVALSGRERARARGGRAVAVAGPTHHVPHPGQQERPVAHREGWSVRVCWWGQDTSSEDVVVHPPPRAAAEGHGHGHGHGHGQGQGHGDGGCLFHIRTDRRRVMTYFADFRPHHNMVRFMVIGPGSAHDVMGMVQVPLRWTKQRNDDKGQGYSALVEGAYPVMLSVTLTLTLPLTLTLTPTPDPGPDPDPDQYPVPDLDPTPHLPRAPTQSCRA